MKTIPLHAKTVLPSSDTRMGTGFDSLPVGVERANAASPVSTKRILATNLSSCNSLPRQGHFRKGNSAAECAL
jgi:hypothetical protein